MNTEKYLQIIAITFILVFVSSQVFSIDIGIKRRELTEQDIEAIVISDKGIRLPVVWGDLGKQLIDGGAIDQVKFENLYSQRGGLDEESKKLLTREDNGNLVITKENAGVILNLLWALGLANDNPILREGPMQDEKYGGADRFASTGGWTISKGNAMEHYSVHSLIQLTVEQQELVESVSKNIYRPCCGNSTYFPDCNHGMAMLGLLELAASQGVNEKELYEMALDVNSYWFPSIYVTIAKYFEMREVDWKDVNAKEVLGSLYSSASGYNQVLSEVEPVKTQGGGSCGV